MGKAGGSSGRSRAVMSSILLLALQLGCSAPTRVPPGPTGARVSSSSARLPVRGPGRYTETLERSNGPSVRYAIEVPSTYSDSARAPLVLALHYNAGPRSFDVGRAFLETLVAPALHDLGAVIIAPDALGGPWNTPVADEAVMILLDAALASYNIDPRRVVVTGFSMGGLGTWHFAGAYPDRFSAAVPVAGRPPATAGRWRLPVFAVHSRDDTVVPIGPTEARIAELARAGVNARLVVLSGMTHFETPRYTEGLAQAVPWLKRLWARR